MQTTFFYHGTEFTIQSATQGESRTHFLVVNGVIMGEPRRFSSPSKKQAVDMFKKAVRKSENKSL